MIKLTAIFLSVLAGSTLVVCILMSSLDSDVRDLGKELGKVTAQVALVAVLGGVIVQEYNRKRDRKSAVNEFRRTILRQLIQAYTGTRKSQRLLRARCRVRDTGNGDEKRAEIPRSTYNKQLKALSDIQLDLEVMIHELNTFSGAFSRRNTIRNYIKRMQEYLARLGVEYEHGLGKTEELLQCVAIADLPRLEDFTRTGKNSEFRKKFVSSFHSALQLIQAERLHVG